MTIGLLAGIDRHVAAEEIERLLGDTEGTAVAGGAHQAGAGKSLDDTIDRGVNFARRCDLVTDEPPLRTVTLEPPAVHNKLAREAIADEPREPQVRGAGDDALLARGQGEIGVSRGHHIVSGQQILATATDREGVDGRNPGLLDTVAADFVRTRLGPREAAEQLVDDAHVALDVPEIRDLALVKMCEVDAG